MSDEIQVNAGSDELGQTAETIMPNEVGGEAPSSDAAPESDAVEYDYIDLDEVGNKYAKLTIEGKEVPIRLSDALQGYNREAVSTKRFQEAKQLRQEAEQALRLQQALQTNPGMTMKILAQQAGTTVEDFLGMSPVQQQQAIQNNQEPEQQQYEDPLERALAVERQAREALQQRIERREADEYLHRRVEGLKQQFQVDDNEVREIVGQALQMGVGPEMFPMIHQARAFQRMQAQQQAQGEVQQRTAAEEAQRQAAAANASATIGTGSSATGVTTQPAVDGRMSLHEAFDAAWSQHVR